MNYETLPPKPTCPCKTCHNKGCGEYHSKCEPYQIFTKQQAEYRNAMNRNKNKRYEEISYIRDAMKRAKR